MIADDPWGNASANQTPAEMAQGHRGLFVGYAVHAVRMRKGFDFDVLITRFGVYPGGTAATEPIALVLRNGLADDSFGAGFDCLRLDMHFKHEGRVPRPFAAADIERYHRYLASFPKLTVRRKASRIEILWAMELSSKHFEHGGAPSVAGFEQLSVEVSRALEAVRPRMAKVRDFDFAALRARVDSALASIPRDPDAFVSKLAELRATEIARSATRRAEDPWAALAIDWSEYHPSARTRLDDPFFWDIGDDHAPVGNDTGADILASYRGWRRRQKRTGAQSLAYVEKILREWEMHETGGHDAHLVRDEAFIALAFAQVMLDGAVAKEVSSRALVAIERQLASCSRWPQPATRQATLERMKAKLLALR